MIKLMSLMSIYNLKGLREMGMYIYTLFFLSQSAPFLLYSKCRQWQKDGKSKPDKGKKPLKPKTRRGGDKSAKGNKNKPKSKATPKKPPVSAPEASAEPGADRPRKPKRPRSKGTA